MRVCAHCPHRRCLGQALAIHRLWHDAGYAAARLVDVASDEFAARLPAEVGGTGTCRAGGAGGAAERRGSGACGVAGASQGAPKLLASCFRAEPGPGCGGPSTPKPLTRPCPLAQPDVFKSYQLGAAEQLRSQLASHWLPKCADALRRAPPVPIGDGAGAYYR